MIYVALTLKNVVIKTRGKSDIWRECHTTLYKCKNRIMADDLLIRLGHDPYLVDEVINDE